MAFPVSRGKLFRFAVLVGWIVSLSACGDDSESDLAFVEDMAVAVPDLSDLAVTGPAAGMAAGTVSEQALGGADGGAMVDGGLGDVTGGTLSLAFGGAGPATMKAFSWTTSVATARDPETNAFVALTTGGGGAIVWTLSDEGHTLVGTGSGGRNDGRPIARAMLTDLPTGAWSFHLLGPIDHPDPNQSGGEDALELRLGYTITTTAGITANGVVTITVLDDGPSFGPDLLIKTPQSSFPLHLQLFGQARPGADGLRMRSWDFAANTFTYDGTTVTTVAGSAGQYNPITHVWDWQDGTGTYLKLGVETGELLLDNVAPSNTRAYSYSYSDNDGDVVTGTMTWDPF
jgi:hypothetical protein